MVTQGVLGLIICVMDIREPNQANLIFNGSQKAIHVKVSSEGYNY